MDIFTIGRNDSRSDLPLQASRKITANWNRDTTDRNGIQPENQRDDTAIAKLATSSIGGYLRAIPPPELDRIITGFTSE